MTLMEVILTVLATVWMSSSLMNGLASASSALRQTQLQAFADDLAYVAAEQSLSGRSLHPGTSEWPTLCKVEVLTDETSHATQITATCGDAKQVLWLPNTTVEQH